MNARTMVRVSLVLALFCAVGGQQTSYAATLVGNPFGTSHATWSDPVPDRAGLWRINLANQTMMENSGPVPAGGDPSATTNTGNYVPTLLIDSSFTTPDDYDFTTKMYTSDDDLLGVVFGYQDALNYFRVGMRQQSGGTFGGTEGLSVQKVSAGVVTQLNPATPVAGPVAITQAMIDGHVPFDVRVSVVGTDYEVFFNEVSLASGSDSDLMAGKIGIQSWAQNSDTAAAPDWGTEVESIVVEAGGSDVYSETFLPPMKWRRLMMPNSAGTAYVPSANGGDDMGQRFDKGWISQISNGFEWATQTTPNVDFRGPANIIDEPGATSMSDYAMQVRIGSTDDDGVGVVVRAQDDENFYRINFSRQSITATNAWERAPQGLSIQKVKGGVWSELYRDPQDGSAPFLHPDSTNGTLPDSAMKMWDLKVSVLGNQIRVRVIDENGNLHVWAPIYDTDDPLLTGSVGLTTWGNDHSYFTSYRGDPDAPLVIGIPEPSTIALSLLAGLGLFGWSRRRA